MIWAIKDNERITAKPKQDAICPSCNQKVISKCGIIKIWHWAHKNNLECDSFGEPETEWHYSWKKLFPSNNQEVTIQNHRADILSSKGIVIELQSSSISPEKIIERENFYKDMIWILNGETIGKNIEFFKRRFKWKWFPESWNFSKKQILIDLGDSFLYNINLKNNEFNRISKIPFIIEHGGNPFK